MRAFPSAAFGAAMTLLGAGTFIPAFAGCGDIILPGTPDGGIGTGDAAVGADGATPGDDGGGGGDGSTTGDSAIVEDAGPDHALLISEVRSHGTAGDGYGDDFIELYNPAGDAVTLNSTWKVMQETAQGAGCQGAPVTNFIGAGQVIPPHGHLLIGGWEYAGPPAADVAMLESDVNKSIADAASIWIQHGAKIVDALCFDYDDQTKGFLAMTCTFPYVCEGMPASNLPHDGSSGASSAVNASLERLPGGAGGSTRDTGSSSDDFHMIMPANPQNLASAATP